MYRIQVCRCSPKCLFSKINWRKAGNDRKIFKFLNQFRGIISKFKEFAVKSRCKVS